jgi:hypothetical protein
LRNQYGAYHGENSLSPAAKDDEEFGKFIHDYSAATSKLEWNRGSAISTGSPIEQSLNSQQASYNQARYSSSLVEMPVEPVEPVKPKKSLFDRLSFF